MLNMASATEKVNILLHLNLDLNSHMWLVAALLDSADYIAMCFNSPEQHSCVKV